MYKFVNKCTFLLFSSQCNAICHLSMEHWYPSNMISKVLSKYNSWVLTQVGQEAFDQSKGYICVQPVTWWPVRCSNHWATWTQNYSKYPFLILTALLTFFVMFFCHCLGLKKASYVLLQAWHTFLYGLLLMENSATNF